MSMDFMQEANITVLLSLFAARFDSLECVLLSAMDSFWTSWVYSE